MTSFFLGIRGSDPGCLRGLQARFGSLLRDEILANKHSGCLGSPPPVNSNEIVAHLRRQIFWPERTSEPDGRLHLCEVLGAVRTASKVCFEATTLASRERSFEVVGHQLHHLLANEVSA